MRIPTTLVTALLIAMLALPCLGATDYGKPLGEARHKTATVQELLKDPESWVGVTVRVEGSIHDVCPTAGCWIDIAGETPEVIRFKVADGEIVFPTEAKGKHVVAEGVFTRIDMSAEEAVAWARHLADEQGREFDPATDEAPTRIYRIAGAGAVVD